MGPSSTAKGTEQPGGMSPQPWRGPRVPPVIRHCSLSLESSRSQRLAAHALARLHQLPTLPLKPLQPPERWCEPQEGLKETDAIAVAPFTLLAARVAGGRRSAHASWAGATRVLSVQHVCIVCGSITCCAQSKADGWGSRHARANRGTLAKSQRMPTHPAGPLLEKCRSINQSLLLQHFL